MQSHSCKWLVCFFVFAAEDEITEMKNKLEVIKEQKQKIKDEKAKAKEIDTTHAKVSAREVVATGERWCVHCGKFSTFR